MPESGFGRRVAHLGGAARRRLHGIAPEPGTFRSDVVAGVPGAISGVPDGMAASVLAGVNPVYGLYASTVGPIGGGLSSSTRLMVITTTGAAALAAGSAIDDLPADRRPGALFLLTLLAGAAMIAAGLLHLGRLTRFVPHSVMIGFLTGIAVNIVLSQLPNLLGASVSGPYALAKAWDLLLHPSRIDAATTAAGLSALVIMLVVGRTRLAPVASLFALIIPSVVVALVGAATVQLVSDVGDIPAGLPAPDLPSLRDLSFNVIVGALAVAAVVLVQGAGVAESAPNPDNRRSNANQDFVAQGIGNVLAGMFRGQPVGGSVGRTALNVSVGARGRWAAIFSGIFMAIILAALSGIVGQVVMATLAAVLIVAAVGALRTGDMRAILRTGRFSQVAVISTFIATLFLPVAAAVGVGLVVSLLMQMNQDALDLRVVQLVPLPDGRFTEQPAPRTLASHEVVLLDVYGSLYYAGARTLQTRLPDPSAAERPAVVLRLRGRAMLGATAFAVLSDYAQRLADAGGRLYLSGVDPAVVKQIRRNATVERAGVSIFAASEVVGEASLDAYNDARAWLAESP